MPEAKPDYEMQTHAGELREFVFPLGTRFVRFYALPDGADAWFLVDAGLPGHYNAVLDAGDLPGKITAILITHADADHLGSVAEVLQRFPECELLCHALDQAWCEDHDRLVAERYGCAQKPYGYGYPEAVQVALRDACGDDFKITKTLLPGETLNINGVDWLVLHLPGHSLGHIAIWNADEAVLVGGDAILGYGPPDASGAVSMPPTHQFIRHYLSTIEFLSQLEVSQAFFAHWKPMNATGFQRLVAESAEVVSRDLKWLMGQPTNADSFEALLDGINAAHSCWDSAENGHYQYALLGYLEYLAEHGIQFSLKTIR